MMAIKTPNPTDKHVGARIRMRRLMLGMSQTALADGLDLTFQQIQKYEKGVNRVGASRLQQIAHIFRVPVEFFFEGGKALSPRQRELVVLYLSYALEDVRALSEMGSHFLQMAIATISEEASLDTPVQPIQTTTPH